MPNGNPCFSGLFGRSLYEIIAQSGADAGMEASTVATCSRPAGRSRPQRPQTAQFADRRVALDTPDIERIVRVCNSAMLSPRRTLRDGA